MLKTVKGKIVAGVVSVGLLSGVGAAFASMDIGKQLQNWYGKTLPLYTNQLSQDVTADVIKKTAGLPAEYDKLKNDTGKAIDDAKGVQTTAAKGEISNALNSRLTALNSEKENIKSDVEARFAKILADAKDAINKAGTVASQMADQDLTNYTSDKGTKARAAMDAELNKQKDQAASDLQKAITLAKSEIQGKLKLSTGGTRQEIGKAIDAKIAELRTLITKKAGELLEKEKQLIAERAAQDVQAAEDALDGVVAGI
ncbi:hypothetical protein NSQ59_04545 [Margalitia sp. FSL K6-0131]|uniref:hypothetical protein n=1 Tax=Margalitia sp. FSL K6-0131 TaxID=2954604 RepID=UPI0030F67F66